MSETTLGPIARCVKGSATVPVGDQTDADVLRRRKLAWDSRPLTREIYRRYFEAVSRELVPGRVTIEVGGGAGNFKEYRPSTFVSDIVRTPFVDFVADAMAMPVANCSVDNLVMFDVLHHLSHPALMFEEAVRVLRVGGRMVMLEPNVSLFSRVVFRLAHPELVDPSVDPLPEDDRPVLAATGPFAANQAIPSTLFFRELLRFQRRFPQLRLRTRKLDSVLMYPLSGGFSGPCLVPRFMRPLCWAIDRMAMPLRRWLAFRLLVSLERV